MNATTSIEDRAGFTRCPAIGTHSQIMMQFQFNANLYFKEKFKVLPKEFGKSKI